MSSETIFYILGGLLVASALGISFAGLRSERFPGRVFPAGTRVPSIRSDGAATPSCQCTDADPPGRDTGAPATTARGSSPPTAPNR